MDLLPSETIVEIVHYVYDIRDLGLTCKRFLRCVPQEYITHWNARIHRPERARLHPEYFIQSNFGLFELLRASNIPAIMAKIEAYHYDMSWSDTFLNELVKTLINTGDVKPFKRLIEMGMTFLHPSTVQSTIIAPGGSEFMQLIIENKMLSPEHYRALSKNKGGFTPEYTLLFENADDVVYETSEGWSWTH